MTIFTVLAAFAGPGGASPPWLLSHSPQVVGVNQLRQLQTDVYWKRRREWARRQAKAWSPSNREVVSIDALTSRPLGGSLNQPLDNAVFLRRLTLAVAGRIPTLQESEEFLHDRRRDKRNRAIDRLLASPEWADGWVGYWQDVLAENPSVVFPTLNNSGPFRQWIYQSFRMNKPFDQFATELILMENAGGKKSDDGPAGFALATGNDAPMAMRAHVVMKAFAAVDLKCARCHDSPVDRFEQQDLFLLAAYLNNRALEVPSTSVAAVNKVKNSAIETSLSAGQEIEPTGLSPHWLEEPRDGNDLYPLQPGKPRSTLAALITSPRNSRFSDVIVNRVWRRYFGEALVEPVDRWNTLSDDAPPEVLRRLSQLFVQSGYDLKALARLILRSDVWQHSRASRRRMTAEQLIDSLFTAVGKDFQAETLGVHATDPGAAQLPRPHRAWQFSALPNERDRPSLGMPVNQTIVDVMTTFGWNGNRQQPRTVREHITSPQQPLMLFNGLMSQRIVRLSDRSAITKLCLEDLTVFTLVNKLFLTVLSRLPDQEERRQFVALLSPGFERRRTGAPAAPVPPLSTFQPDWRKHLEPEQTRLMLAAQARVAQGEPPTKRLTENFRQRAEDALWVLINSPEFVLIP